MSVKETGIVELLPAERDVRISTRRILSEKAIADHDAVIVICDREITANELQRAPFGALIARKHRLARSRGPVSVLITHAGQDGVPIVVAFAKESSAFEQLSLAARSWKALANDSIQRVLIGTIGLAQDRSTALLECFIAAILAGTAATPSMKSKRTPSPVLESITVITDDPKLDAARPIALDRGNHLARWLTALPPNVLDSAGFRRAIGTLARRHKWSFEFLSTTSLQRLKAGAFLAVARANEHANAGIVRLRRRARNRSAVRGRIALVGKGICFDTGGINLKSHKSMYLMHEDMQGGAVALGTLLTLSELDAPYDIDCWIAITENNIGPRAYRPQEVVTAANGVTIQVVHSDAEGRMALADTLAIATRDKPDLILDFATLTGSCVTALTDRYSGVFTNRAEWHATLESAGRESGERVWPFPMDQDFDSELDSTIADILQCTPDSKGDHILAARFLSRFIPAGVPWVHVDLASSNRTGGLAHVPTDYTGFGVRFATQLLLNHDLIGKRGKAIRRLKNPRA